MPDNLFTKFDQLSERVDSFYQYTQKLPFGMTFDDILTPTKGVVDGKEVILAGTNNYLGLTFDDRVTGASKAAIDAHGTGTTGSRLANGTYSEHVELEKELRAYYNAAGAMVCTTGYQANLAAISTLAGKGDHLILDSDNHACIFDGARLSDASTYVFPHNSPEALDKRLSRLPEEGARLVVIEGLYSMLGDVAPVAEFTEVAHKHGAMIMVDEAHSVGVFGDKGRGVSEAQGVLDKVDFISGTFSKSFASIGGYVVSRHEMFDLIRMSSRPYLFTASGSPANVATARASLKVMSDANCAERARLWERATKLHQGLSAAGFEPASDIGPVIAIARPDDQTALKEWYALLQAGVYVNLALPPATPHNMSLLRLSVSAAHTEDEIDHILAAFKSVAG